MSPVSIPFSHQKYWTSMFWSRWYFWVTASICAWLAVPPSIVRAGSPGASSPIRSNTMVPKVTMKKTMTKRPSRIRK